MFCFYPTERSFIIVAPRFEQCGSGGPGGGGALEIVSITSITSSLSIIPFLVPRVDTWRFNLAATCSTACSPVHHTHCIAMLPTFHSPISFIYSLFGTILIFLMCIPNIPGQDHVGTQKPSRFYIGGVLSSTATARAFTMEAQVRRIEWNILDIFGIYLCLLHAVW